MFHFWLILLSAKVVRILRPHRAGPTAETIHMEIQRGGSRVNAQWGVNMQQRIIYIKFVGTHAEYDKVDAASVDQS
jgi:hypothetical protein